MKKWPLAVSGVVLAGAVAWVGSAWMLGRKAQDLIEQGVAQANQTMAEVVGQDPAVQGAQLGIEQYDRGVFSSNIRYALQLQDSNGQSVQLTFTDHLLHGPFPWQRLLGGDWAPVLAFSQVKLQASPLVQAWVDAHQGASPLVATTLFRLAGQGQTQVAILSGGFDTAAGQRAEFSNGTLDATFDANGVVQTMQGTMARLALIEPTSQTLVFNGLRVRAQGSAAGIMAGQPNTTGKVDLEADKLSLMGPNAAQASLTGFSTTLTWQQQDNLLSGQAAYAAKQLMAAGADLGAVSAGIEVRRINLPAMTALIAEYQAMQVDAAAGSTPDPESSEALRRALFNLLASRPVIRLAPLSWETADGRFQGQVQLNLRQPGSQWLNAPPGLLLPELIDQVDLNMTLDKALFVSAFAQWQSPADADRANAMGRMLFDHFTSRWQRQGLVQLENDRLTLSAHYANGKVVAGSRSLTPAELFAVLLAAN